jgi:hypothetical protein
LAPVSVPSGLADIDLERVAAAAVLAPGGVEVLDRRAVRIVSVTVVVQCPPGAWWW